MKNNFSQGLNMDSPYYKQATEMGKLVAKAGNASELEATGYSLGGGLSSAFAEASGATGTTFNAAGLSPETVARYGGAVHPTSITAYHVDGEILTGLQEPSFADRVLNLIKAAIGDLMPKAVSAPVALPGTSVTSVGNHMMGDVTNGISRVVQDDQSSLASLLGMH